MADTDYNSENYLTMARIMAKEWKKWRDNDTEFRKMTGMGQIKVQEAFNIGFMAGFSGRYFDEGY